MVRLQRVLLIDDEYGQFEDELGEDFKKNNIDIRFCETKDKAVELLDTGMGFDLVILDWFLEEDNNFLSRLVLKHLQNRSFVPVFIWSNHIANYNESVEKGEVEYPENLIKGIAKEDVSVEAIQDKVSEWFQESLPAQISNVYRRQIRQGLEKVFFELVQVPNQDIASLLKFLVGDGQNIDWSNDFILNLLHRELIRDREFCEGLAELLQHASSISGKGDYEERRQILNKVLYYQSDAKFIRCGDIIQFQSEDNKTTFGIVVNPACDLENKNTRYMELVELRKLRDETFNIKSSTKNTIMQYKHPSFYPFPAVALNSELDDFVGIFKSKIVLEQRFPENTVRYPGTSKRVEYSDIFLLNKQDIRVEFICRLDNPYKSDFLQKLHAHNSRVGIPDIKNLLE